MTRGGRTDIIATCLLLVGIWAVMVWDVFRAPRPLDALGSPEMSCAQALSDMDAALPVPGWLATRTTILECLSEGERDPAALEAAFPATIRGGQGACVALAPLHRSRHAVGSRCTGELDFTHFYHAMRPPPLPRGGPTWRCSSGGRGEAGLRRVGGSLPSVPHDPHQTAQGHAHRRSSRRPPRLLSRERDVAARVHAHLPPRLWSTARARHRCPATARTEAAAEGFIGPAERGTCASQTICT